MIVRSELKSKKTERLAWMHTILCHFKLIATSCKKRNLASTSFCVLVLFVALVPYPDGGMRMFFSATDICVAIA